MQSARKQNIQFLPHENSIAYQCLLNNGTKPHRSVQKRTYSDLRWSGGAPSAAASPLILALCRRTPSCLEDEGKDYGKDKGNRASSLIFAMTSVRSGDIRGLRGSVPNGTSLSNSTNELNTQQPTRNFQPTNGRQAVRIRTATERSGGAISKANQECR